MTNFQFDPKKRVYLETNPEGYFVNTSSLSNVAENELVYLDEIIEIYQTVFKDIHSIYIRGSFVQKRYFPIHDIDVFCITKSEITEEARQNLKLRINSLEKLKLDDSSLDIRTLMDDPGVGFYRSFEIKTQSICIFGDDLRDEIQDYSLSPKFVKQINDDIEAVIKKARKKLTLAKDTEEISSINGWFMKRAIRNTHLLIALNIGKFTRDINTCVLDLIEHFPNEEALITSMGLNSISPSGNIRDIYNLIDEFDKWYESILSNFYKKY